MKTLALSALFVTACFLSACGSHQHGNAGMVRSVELAETRPTAVQNPEGSPGARDMGEKQYSPTTLHTFDYPIKQIRIKDDGDLVEFTLAFADPAVPNDGLPHRYQWVSFNGDGTIALLGPAAAETDPCTIHVIVANGETNYQCDNDGNCVAPDTCRLLARWLFEKWTYSCFCGQVGGGGGGGGT